MRKDRRQKTEDRRKKLKMKAKRRQNKKEKERRVPLSHNNEGKRTVFLPIISQIIYI